MCGMRFDSVTVSAGRSSASDDDVVNLLLLQRSLKIVGCVSVSGAGEVAKGLSSMKNNNDGERATGIRTEVGEIHALKENV